jgi:putative addiction module component (TIGR02574 family)
MSGKHFRIVPSLSQHGAECLRVLIWQAGNHRLADSTRLCYTDERNFSEKGNLMLAEIQQLSVAERIQLIDDIWDSIADAPDTLPLTQELKEELDYRLEAMQQNPQETITWAQLKATLKNR